ncbi:hypothetical protein BFU36_08315 [Sulfolobus sp. A20]|uniref:hypothetical protein n=1 Tax=Saccharolobus sp. A20 TaxID=1891280 RepID=UPI000845D897|nr:hypothetical protein [Sulfolobus sp. A20]TRM77858.1 hypothetical protein DJ532_02920 [Sulfolobus sp. A20-N-F8]TRM79125.1 hypothetical protein DJ528_02605 [Sulfolobus sp. B5]TRM82736.1 hypothetical protein DJ531_08605 [Sulfolobus sp. A20-N-F6]TRM89575.1 hypothetical protein DJ529_01590 [Sulfolobus sp. C3]TRM93384.1 hypothetical protein DJ526_04095 [Sulfolobus sp. A20-N-G8]TRM97499.1 hypothetical protein DJ527_11910 [Sulfolobus sp. F1]TRN01369.1 hypothetical protein DJ530_06055 [Sulfolobus 
MAIGKIVLIAGAVILIIGIALFFIGGFTAASGLKGLQTDLSAASPITLEPNSSISLGTPAKLTLLLYNTSLGKALKVLQNVNGTNTSASQISEVGYVAALLQPKYQAYIVNNFTTPVAVKYAMSNAEISSLLNGAILTGLGFFFGIIGVIIIIVGIILYLRSRKK